MALEHFRRCLELRPPKPTASRVQRMIEDLESGKLEGHRGECGSTDRRLRYLRAPRAAQLGLVAPEAPLESSASIIFLSPSNERSATFFPFR